MSANAANTVDALAERIPEALELMDDEAQVGVYEKSPLEEPHLWFVDLFRARFPGESVTGRVLDLGCGVGEVTRPFARAFPRCRVDGVDGAPRMVAAARRRLGPELAGRVRFHEARLGRDPLPGGPFDAVLSSALLHHLPDPGRLWDAVLSAARPGAPVLVLDLVRPASREEASALVARFSHGSLPPRMEEDFFHSLLAAWRPPEVEAQLRAAGLGGFRVERLNEIQMIAWGRTP